jgi:O-succinylbenzoic acid--CoA ligase
MNNHGAGHHWWADSPLPSVRNEAHYGDRIVRCFAQRVGSFYELLSSTVAKHGENEALICGPNRVKWRTVANEVARAAGGLTKAGVGRGDRVAMFMSNREEFVVLLFAIQQLGAIAVPIGTREQREGLSWVLGQSGAKMICLDADLVDRLPTRPETPSLEIVVLCGTGDASGGGMLAYRDLVSASPCTAVAQVDEEDVAVILYTSGTTGRPKGAMLTHLNIVHSTQHFVSCMDLTFKDRSMLAVPASHVTGLIANVAAMVAAGGALIIVPAFKAIDFLALAAKERVTHTLMVPAMYNLLLLEPEFSGYDLSAWRIGGYGGAPMPVASIDALAQRLPGLTLLNAYGATETTSPTTMMPPGLTRQYAYSVGVPLPCAEVLVVNDGGQQVLPGDIGEIWISGPMVVRGYWENPDASAREFTAGWWHSGDLGSIDADGFVRVLDRKKDMLNRGGYKIFSLEVENTLMQLNGVIEVGIVGKPCPVLGERVHAFIYAKPGTVTLEVVRAHCADRLADYKTPESITLVDTPLPRNANGKLLKRELRMQLLEHPG